MMFGLILSTFSVSLMILLSDTRIITSDMVSSLECNSSPCSSDESGLCQVYHDNQGCSQCISNSFKFGANFECVNCQTFFGNECLHCSDNIGCQECDSENGYYRTSMIYNDM